MTGAQLKTQTENILDGISIDDDFFYELLNIAKTKLEESRLWQYLKALDSSNTATSGNNYETGYTLPTYFAEDYRVFIGKDTEYYPVAFEEQHLFRNSANRYVLDLGQNKIFLLGNVRAGTIYLYYKKWTADLTSGSSPVFPARFQPILSFMVAAYYQGGIDADDIFARMSPENRAAAMELQRSMISWDTSLQMRAQNDRIGVSDSAPEVYLGNM